MNIIEKINRFEANEQVRLTKLKRYYEGKNDILRKTAGEHKPCNKLVHNFAKCITNNTVGYYLGIPTLYGSEDKNLQEEIYSIANYNDDAFHNASIGRDVSKYGIGYELIYIDDDKNIRYVRLDPLQTIVKYKNDLEKTIDYAIRFYDVEDDNLNVKRYIEVYKEDCIEYYDYDSTLRLTDKKTHYFGQVPVNVYENNAENQGDYEDVITLIDAYDKMQSGCLDDYELFADAYLALVKMFGTEQEDIEKLREDRLLLLDENGGAFWLTKDVNDTYIENNKNRYFKDIFTFSNTVNMLDENFSNNLSGVAISYKLMGMENRVSITERYFKRGLQRRFELICAILNVKGGNYNYLDIDITFTRNIPKNDMEKATMIQQLDGIVSKETLISQLSFIADSAAEVEKAMQESDYYAADFGGVTENEEF